MKKIYIVSLAGLAMLGANAAANADSYKLDPAHTYPYFSISHLGFSTMRGRFNHTSGTFTLDMAKGTGSVNIEIDVNSIDTAFEKRNQHLRSPDFFNAVEFPKMTYKSTKVTIHKDHTAMVEGNLTMHGITKPVALKVEKITCGANPMNKKEMCGFDATAVLKRSEFGINYGLPAIGDEININIEAEGYKQ